MKGKDVCDLHGGKTPIKHGLYSKYRFSDPLVAANYDRLMQHYKDNPISIKDLTPEIVLIKSYLQTLIEKAPETDAKLTDFVSQLVLRLSWIIEKHVKVNEGETINVKSYQAVVIVAFDQILDLAKEFIPKGKYEKFLKRADEVSGSIDAGANSAPASKDYDRS